jgi:hypothetical protein
MSPADEPQIRPAVSAESTGLERLGDHAPFNALRRSDIWYRTGTSELTLGYG